MGSPTEHTGRLVGLSPLVQLFCMLLVLFHQIEGLGDQPSFGDITLGYKDKGGRLGPSQALCPLKPHLQQESLRELGTGLP